jgi:protein translocase SEC61 complex gamma subunit
MLVDNGAAMGLRSFLSSVVKMLKLAKKPGKDELWLSIKICLLGIVLVGVLGFVIKLISGLLQAWSGS